MFVAHAGFCPGVGVTVSTALNFALAGAKGGTTGTERQELNSRKRGTNCRDVQMFKYYNKYRSIICMYVNDYHHLTGG